MTRYDNILHKMISGFKRCGGAVVTSDPRETPASGRRVEMPGTALSASAQRFVRLAEQ
jgi:hypothetical protein